jgi:hypothetical protein
MGVLHYTFDKNSAPQFIALMLCAICLAGFMVMRRDRYTLPPYLLALVSLLLLAEVISAIRSGNFMASVIGDVGRYTGIISVVALVLVAIFHSGFQQRAMEKLVSLYLVAIFATEVVAILQKFNLITMPGVPNSITSTFGNLDFFSAFIATTLPLTLFVFLISERRGKIASILVALLGIVCIRLTDAKQGYVDLALTLLIIASVLLVRYLRRNSAPRESGFSLDVRTTLIAFGIFFWVEAIFMVPFLGSSIPYLGNDIQVAIRGVMWLAAINQFKSFPIFGVGPDQYGYFYEHFRTVNSTIVLPGDSTNDAHSASVQTLATVGIVGAILFFALIVILVRSFLLLLERNPQYKNGYYALALFLFIYFTNSMISPITLPNKYLFWAISGFIIGLAHHSNPDKSQRFGSNSHFSQSLIALGLVATLFVGVQFTLAQVKFIHWSESSGTNPNARVKAEISAYLPCAMYFYRIAEINLNQGDARLEKISRDQVAINSRCLNAQEKLADLGYNSGNMVETRKRIYTLIDLAPSRRDILDLATLYAIRDKDLKLQGIIAEQLSRMGVKTIQIN